MAVRLDMRALRGWLIVLGLVFACPSGVPTIVGCGSILLGVLIRLWCRGYLRDSQLTVAGPYRWSRNPLAVADLLIDLGLCLVINRLWLTILLLVVWAFVCRREILRQERTLEATHGEAWDRYKRLVPAFVPYRRAYRDVPADQRFSWTSPDLVQGAEVAGLIRTASYPLLLLLAGSVGPSMWLRGHGSNLAWLGSSAGMCCLAGFIALQGLAAAVRKQLVHRRPALPDVLRNHGVQLGLVLVYLAVLTVSTLGLSRPSDGVVGVSIGLLLAGYYAMGRRRRSPRAVWDIASWLGALGGAGLLVGLPWAAILGVTAALILCLDVRLAASEVVLPGSQMANPEQPASPRALWDRLSLATYYTLFGLAVVAIALGKAAN